MSICFVSRDDVDPRYDPQSASWGPENCGHAECAADQCEGFHDWDCVAVDCLWNRMHAVCDLEQGHSGDHQFVREDELVLEFVP